jgi:hypothetical protein
MDELITAMRGLVDQQREMLEVLRGMVDQQREAQEIMQQNLENTRLLKGYLFGQQPEEETEA